MKKHADLADLGVASQAVGVFKDGHGGRGAGRPDLDHRTPLCKARALFVILLWCPTQTHSMSLLADLHPLGGSLHAVSHSRALFAIHGANPDVTQIA